MLALDPKISKVFIVCYCYWVVIYCCMCYVLIPSKSDFATLACRVSEAVLMAVEAGVTLLRVTKLECSIAGKCQVRILQDTCPLAEL